MKVTYAGEPAWKVAYELSYALPMVETGIAARFPLTGREVGYRIVFTKTLKKARQRAKEALYSVRDGLAKTIEFFNTEPWHGEPLDKRVLMETHEKWRQMRSANI